jgi:hypothetical protein
MTTSIEAKSSSEAHSARNGELSIWIRSSRRSRKPLKKRCATLRADHPQGVVAARRAEVVALRNTQSGSKRSKIAFEVVARSHRVNPSRCKRCKWNNHPKRSGIHRPDHRDALRNRGRNSALSRSDAIAASNAQSGPTGKLVRVGQMISNRVDGQLSGLSRRNRNVGNEGNMTPIVCGRRVRWDRSSSACFDHPMGCVRRSCFERSSANRSPFVARTTISYPDHDSYSATITETASGRLLSHLPVRFHRG